MPIPIVVICVLVVALIALALSVRIVKQYEQSVLFRLGRVLGVRKPAGPAAGAPESPAITTSIPTALSNGGGAVGRRS